MRFYFAFRTVTVFVDVYDIDGNFVFYRLLDDGYYGFGVILTVPSRKVYKEVSGFKFAVGGIGAIQ